MRLFLFLTTIINALSEMNLRGSSTNIVSDIEDINDETYHWREFTNFQERFNKRYSNLEEIETRFTIFRENLIHIFKHNRDITQNFTMGVNQFTDLTLEEFKTLYLGGFKSEQIEQKELGSYGCKTFSSSAPDSPNSIDWRNKGVVNPIRDQGQCGSCWAFATTANAESVWAIYSGKLFDFSEELLVDCASGVGYFNLGCNGGNPDSAFKYMINNGQCSETSYPYNAGTTKTAGTCQKCDSETAHFSSCYDVKSNDQISLRGAVAKQPVTVAIEADTRYFQSYSGGILDSSSCGTNLDHAVEIIGYGTENGIDYWNVRNSWGSSWGENGYVRIKRTSSINDPGICGISISPSFIAV